MKQHPAETEVLIRATRLDDRIEAFGASIAEASGHAVSFVLDGRFDAVPAGRPDVIPVLAGDCARLGLFCPADFRWKCGDYGYYLARRRSPQTEFFWMIEDDVRFSQASGKEFFAFFEQQGDIDFLASCLGRADPVWHWAPSVRARDIEVQQCLFPVTRVSRRAIDALLSKRIEHSRRIFRRLRWPNDEAMVATTLVDAGFRCRDFNSFGRTFYTTQSFSFDSPIDGDRSALSETETLIHHPVLFGERYQDKVRRLAKPLEKARLSERIAARVNAHTKW